MLEQDIRDEILKYLNSLDFSFFKKVHGGALTKKFVDIIGSYKGKFVALEVKRSIKGYKTTKNQKEFLININKSKGIGRVVYKLEDVKRILKEIDKMSEIR